MKDQTTLTKPVTIKSTMLIRKSVPEVFQAFTDPEITIKFWFSKSSGTLQADAIVTWEWEKYGASDTIKVIEFTQNKRIVMTWNNQQNNPTTIEWEFTPVKDTGTFVTVTEFGYTGDGDTIVETALGSLGGFTMVLCAAKALLEHGIILSVVDDHAIEE